jgi:hypothetical protein
MSDRQIKREIKSYGIFSIHIEEDIFPSFDLDDNNNGERMEKGEGKIRESALVGRVNPRQYRSVNPKAEQLNNQGASNNRL